MVNSQHQNNKNLCLNKDINLLNEIVDMKKFKRIDSRYMITDICKSMDLKYEFKEDSCNVYSGSFSFNISFHKNDLNVVVCFIDPKDFNDVDEDKFIIFLKCIVINRQLDISLTNLRSILIKILKGKIEEFKDKKDNCEFYASKIINDNKELIFIMLRLNA